MALSRVHALKSVDFELSSECVALLGENGAGKYPLRHGGAHILVQSN